MTSTNSLNSKSRFLPQLKEVFRRNIVMCAIFQAFFAIISFGLTFLCFQMCKEILDNAVEGYKVDITSQLSFYFSLVYLLFGALLWLFPLTANMYREIFSKRSSVFYFSVPVKRETYFNANILFGIINIVLSFVLTSGISLAFIKSSALFRAGSVTLETGKFIGVLAVCACGLAALFAILVLCAVISGRMWHYVLFSLIAVFSLPSGFTALTAYINSIWGFDLGADYSWIVSPFGFFVNIANEGGFIKYIIASLVQFAIAYAVGLAVFKKRKSEIAEISVSGNAVPIILIVICQFSYAVRAIGVFGGGYIGIPAAIAAALIVTMILSAIFYKKAFTKTTAKCFACVAAASLAVCLCVELIPRIGYINNVPQASDVESVTIDENINSSDDFLSDLIFMPLGFSDYTDFEIPLNTFTFKSDDAKEKVEVLHKKIVEQATIDNYGSEDYNWYGGYSFALTYNLKDGSTLKRTYSVAANDILLEFADLMQTREALEQLPILGNINDEDILFIGIDDYSDNWQLNSETVSDEYEFVNPSSSFVKLGEYDTLRENIIKDMLNQPKKYFLDSLAYIETDFSQAIDVYNYFGELKSYDDFSESELDDFFNRDIENLGLSSDWEIIVYYYSGDVTDEMKKKLDGMTPKELVEYDIKQSGSETEYGGIWVLNENTVYLNSKTDKNTVAYLKSVM